MKLNIILFPDFETLDVFGPVEIFGKQTGYSLHYYSLQGGIITSSQGTQVVTEQLNTDDIEGIILIPGGQGTRTLVSNEAFIDRLKIISEKSQYCLTVCTGSALLAKTGLLKMRKATTNKNAFHWVMSQDLEVIWIKKARWVRDGKFYTSSGVSAGMDMSLGFIADQFGIDSANEIARKIEYLWNSDQETDPFACTDTELQ
jgi:putative intracellular protease/amidase